ncbi:hypothetical protein ABZ567_31360 [Streptomyces sp. NPDC016459]|uniref:hypothetical protein n=1 Tax=Streptomyces sp. NPDC016459 TaxID=3157190 RepID=UPI0033D8053E
MTGLAERFAARTRLLDGGHMEWTGPLKGGRSTPLMYDRGRDVTARAVAFRIATGRAPVGYVRAECDHPGCVAPEHMADAPTRTKLRTQLAQVQGRDLSLTECGRGHATAVHRQFNPDGHPYCRACEALREHERQAVA